MRHLLLLRHAKATQGGPGIADRERPLTLRGKRDAALMGTAMTADRVIPDLVLCSPARRTRETLDDVLSRLPTVPQVVIVDAFYGAASVDYVNAISEFGGTARHLLVVGHNPIIHARPLRSPDQVTRRSALASPRSSRRQHSRSLLSRATRGRRSFPGSGELVSLLRPGDLDSGTKRH